jgi:hypothetical protein
MPTDVRTPAVAGTFYPGEADALAREMARLVPEDAETTHELLACVAPHAGYVYSGQVAGRVFGHLKVPRRVLLMGPNHTGMGAAVSVAPHAAWATPHGEVPVDRDLGDRLLEAVGGAEAEPRAHGREHSLEVMLPFLLARRPDVAVLPVCLAHLSKTDCRRLGAALARVIDDLDEPVGIVASSDMSHYEPDAVTRERDRLAIDAMLALDPDGLYDTVHSNGITMCGVVPATVALVAATELGAIDAHLVDYATSGDVSGDRSAVVGYAGICIHA